MNFILSFLFLIVPLSLSAESLSEIHHYDSGVAWGARVDRFLDRVLNDLFRFLTPVKGVVSSHYGERKHPIFGLVKHHNGIDIACAEGSEVRSVLPATVKMAGWVKGYGKTVILRHSGPISETRYAHLLKILVGEGETVVRGQLIGHSGMTGLATGPHLHFEVYRNGGAVDPEQLLRMGHRG